MIELTVAKAHELPPSLSETRWLITDLWGQSDVGILGGEPKCCKSFLALQMAVAVASGTPCLERFEVPEPGRVLLFAAEDALPTVRKRLDGICSHVGISLRDLELWLITSPVVRLDLEEHSQALTRLVMELRPQLLILDPFVRLHRVDENASAAVAPLLASLRTLQRTYECAILVVHHARKGGAARAGQALRGSSEFHAWGDANLYLRRHRHSLRLTVEHRAAPGLDNLCLRLQSHSDAVALVLDAQDLASQDANPSPSKRVLKALKTATQPLASRQLRQVVHMRMATMLKALKELEQQGLIQKTPQGWQANPAVSRSPSP